jgi:hypothetical protein
LTERTVAQQGNADELVTLQELAVSSAYEIAALVAVLERKGLLTQQVVLEEIAKMKQASTHG